MPWDVLIHEAAEAGQASLEHGAALEGGSGAAEEVAKARAVPAAIAEAIKTNSNFPAVLDAIAKAGNKILDQYSTDRAKDEFALFVRHRTYLTPTLVTLRSVTFIDDLSKQPDKLSRFSPKWEQDRWKPTVGVVTANRTPAYIAYRKREYLAVEKALALANKSGVGILAGTDVGSAYTHAGFSLHEEMEWLVKAGLPPRDALQAATSNPAAFFRDEYGIGTMKEGSVASFVLLNDNPLKDIRNVGKIHAVILKGKALLRNDLDELLRTAEAEAAAGR